jgi:hypothetical protein
MRVILPPGDEGTLIYDAVRVAQGQVPYRDFFEVMGPGTFYWVALFFKLFGVTWLATRLALVVTSVATALMMFFLTRRLRTRFDTLPAIFLMAVLFGYIWPAISHHGDSNLLALFAFAAFVVWLDRQQTVLLVAAGALAALTTCVLQPKGVLLFLAFLVLLVVLCRKDAGFVSYMAWLSTGYVAVVACVLLFFWAAGGLHDLVYATFIWPLTRYSNVNSVPYGLGIDEFYWKSWAQPLSAALSPAVGHTIAGILIAPFLLVAALPVILPIVSFCNRSRAFNRALLPYWIAGAALWLSEIHRKDITHLVYGSPLLIILLICLLSQIGHQVAWRAIQLVAVSAVTLATFNACLTLAARAKTTTVRGSMYMFKKDPVLAFLNAHVKPGEELFVYSYSPMYYFLSGTNNPTRYSVLMYQINTDTQFDDAARSLKASSVRYVVWDNFVDSKPLRRFFPKYHPPPRAERVIEVYLTQHFTVVYQHQHIRVLEKIERIPVRDAPCPAPNSRPSANEDTTVRAMVAQRH